MTSNRIDDRDLLLADDDDDDGGDRNGDNGVADRTRDDLLHIASATHTSASRSMSLVDDAAILNSLSLLSGSPQSSRHLPDWLRDPVQLKAIADARLRAIGEERHALRESATQEFGLDAQDEATIAIETLVATNNTPFTMSTPAVVALPTGGRVICFDIETTGFGREDCIIEIGACELIDGQSTGLLFQSYAAPTAPIHPAAEAVHGLSLEFLSDEPPLSQVLASFVEFIGDSPLVAHNMAFDRRFLSRALERRGRELPNPTFCTMHAFRRMYPGQKFSLEAAIGLLKLHRGTRASHSALDDARTAARLYAHLVGLDRAKKGEFASAKAMQKC